MTEETVTSNTIRSDLVDTAIGFLKNAKVASESVEKKREFLQKKGLTDNEIEYAFKIIPHKETNKKIVSNNRPSFLRRILSDLILAGLIGFAFKLIKRWFRSKQSIKANDLIETIKNLQKTIQEMQTSVKRLEQTTEQLHLTLHSSPTNGSSSSLEEIKREIQQLKNLSLSRSQFPSIPKIPPTIPAWQLEEAEKRKARASPIVVETNNKTTQDDNKDDVDSIVVVSENDKRSDEENQLSMSPSSASSNDTYA
ncbi:unnamed protein product [Adineta steineri]|uniref:Peroxisomal membrane protein PEX14 n=1 Tax=Adineta steineri TaxID=433720 RepID=A0A814DXB0_9BILA|nr:unnamed protein product [Adineta steineri]CAF3744277.1 unnamed protein product [Adineta steineri]